MELRCSCRLAEYPRQPQRALHLLARAVPANDGGEGVEERPGGGRSELGVVEALVELDDLGESRGRERPAADRPDHQVVGLRLCERRGLHPLDLLGQALPHGRDGLEHPVDKVRQVAEDVRRVLPGELRLAVKGEVVADEDATLCAERRYAQVGS